MAELSLSRTFTVADRRWRITVNPIPVYPYRVEDWHAWAGVGIVFLITFLMVRNQIAGIRTSLLDEQRLNEITREVEHRRVTEKSLLLHSEIIKQMAEGVCLVRLSDGKVIYTNPGFDNLFGYDSDELIGKHFSVINAPTGKNPEDTAGEIIAAIAMQGTWQGEILSEKKDGTSIRCWANISRFQTEDHGTVAVSVHDDITERKQVEQALKFSEERFRCLVETISDWIWEVDTNAVYTYVSPKVKELLGYEPEEVLGKRPFDFMPLGEADRISGIFASTIELGQAFSGLENTNIHKDGREIVVESNGIPVRDSQGILTGYRGIDRDMTERKQAEMETRKAASYLDNASDSIIVLNNQAEIIRVNKEFTKLWEYAADEVIGLPLTTVFPESEIPKHKQEMATAGSTKQARNFETVALTKSGLKIPLHIRGTGIFNPQGELEGFLGVFRDISTQKEAERALINSEEKYRMIFEGSPLGIMHFDERGIATACNQKFAEIIGAPMEQIPGFNMLKQLKDKKMKTAVESSLSGAAGHYEGDYLSVMGNKLTFVKADYAPMLSKERGILGGISLWEDITDRKQAEDEVKKSEARFKTLASNIPGIIYRCANDTDWTVEYMSDEIKTISGYPASDFLNQVRSYASIIHPDDRQRVEDTVSNLVDQKKPFALEYRIVAANGKVRWIFERGQATYDEQGNVLWLDGANFDVTDRKEAEEKLNVYLAQLQKSNKELSDFAYIVSHDLKEPIRAVNSLTQWILADYGEQFDEAGREKIDLLLGRVRRMNDLVEGILHYSRAGHLKRNKTRIDLNMLVQEVIDVIENRQSVAIQTEGTLPVILAERTSIYQIFQNLIGNAMKYIDKPDGKIRISGKEQDKSWRFCVEDNGPGIEKKDYQKIFQLFGVLHPRDRVEASGVGLAVVKKIVEMYGGKVWVDSEVGKRSSFYFSLPK